jgi:hypothetical protein
MIAEAGVHVATVNYALFPSALRGRLYQLVWTTAIWEAVTSWRRMGVRRAVLVHGETLKNEVTMETRQALLACGVKPELLPIRKFARQEIGRRAWATDTVVLFDYRACYWMMTLGGCDAVVRLCAARTRVALQRPLPLPIDTRGCVDLFTFDWQALLILLPYLRYNHR